MLRKMTLGGRLATMLGLLAVLTMMVAIAGTVGVLQAGNRQQESAAAADDHAAMLEAARGAQLHFMRQLHAWKSALLKSNEPADLRRNLDAFVEHERLVQERLAALAGLLRENGLDTEAVDEVAAMHAGIAPRYREALRRLELAKAESDQAVDESVRGVDTQTGDALESLVVAVQQLASENRWGHRDAAEANIARTRWRMAVALMIWFAIAGFGSARIVRSITTPAGQALAVSRSLASGELGVRVEAPGSDELGQMLQSLGKLAEDLRRTLGETRAASGTLVGTADEIVAAARRTLQSSQQQATAVQQTTTSTAELAETVRVTEQRAADVQVAMDRTLQTSQRIREELGETQDVLGVTREELRSIVAGIQALVARNEQIGEIIENVREVADQTQLLAVNAGIEAVKAGDLGRGFGVVAAEMKALADQSKKAAHRIRGIVGEVQRSTVEVVRIVETGRERVQEALRPVGEMVPRVEQLAGQVEDSAASLKQILAIVQQQTVGIEQINQAMKVVQGAVQESLAQNQQLDESAESLRGQAKQLDDSVSGYRF